MSVLNRCFRESLNQRKLKQESVRKEKQTATKYSLSSPASTASWSSAQLLKRNCGQSLGQVAAKTEQVSKVVFIQTCSRCSTLDIYSFWRFQRFSCKAQIMLL